MTMETIQAYIDAQKAAFDTVGTAEASNHPFPTYKDLIQVLEKSDKKICVEVKVPEFTLIVRVRKDDLLKELKSWTPKRRPSTFKLILLSPEEKGVLLREILS